MDTPPTYEEERSGPNRRDVLRRGAILGGAMVWTVPVVQTFGGAAFAATGTPPCSPDEIQVNDPTSGACVTKFTLAATPQCCDCIASHPDPALGAVLCFGSGDCSGSPTPC
jgi:hypothetical protein